MNLSPLSADVWPLTRLSYIPRGLSRIWGAPLFPFALPISFVHTEDMFASNVLSVNILTCTSMRSDHVVAQTHYNYHAFYYIRESFWLMRLTSLLWLFEVQRTLNILWLIILVTQFSHIPAEEKNAHNKLWCSESKSRWSEGEGIQGYCRLFEKVYLLKWQLSNTREKSSVW